MIITEMPLRTILPGSVAGDIVASSLPNLSLKTPDENNFLQATQTCPVDRFPE
jgi:hypothetical protein